MTRWVAMEELPGPLPGPSSSSSPPVRCVSTVQVLSLQTPETPQLPDLAPRVPLPNGALCFPHVAEASLPSTPQTDSCDVATSTLMTVQKKADITLVGAEPHTLRRLRSLQAPRAASRIHPDTRCFLLPPHRYLKTLSSSLILTQRERNLLRPVWF